MQPIVPLNWNSLANSYMISGHDEVIISLLKIYYAQFCLLFLGSVDESEEQELHVDIDLDDDDVVVSQPVRLQSPGTYQPKSSAV